MGNSSFERRTKISERLLEFSVRIMKLESRLCRSFSGKHIYGQLFRSGTSTGANYEESIGAESKADFIHKTQIVLKEMRESNYWLRLIARSDMIPEGDNDLKLLLADSIEFVKIFSSSLITAKQIKK